MYIGFLVLACKHQSGLKVYIFSTSISSINLHIQFSFELFISRFIFWQNWEMQEWKMLNDINLILKIVYIHQIFLEYKKNSPLMALQSVNGFWLSPLGFMDFHLLILILIDREPLSCCLRTCHWGGDTHSRA